MKKNIIAIVSISMSLMVVIAVATYKKNGNEGKDKAVAVSEKTVADESEKENEPEVSIPDDIKEEWEKLKLLGTQNAGHYVYKEKLLLGQIGKLEKRITVSNAKKIVSDNSGKESIMAAFNEFQPVPDFAGGSGISRYEYWLDDEGREMIVVYDEQFAVWYYSQNGSSEQLI